MTRADIKDLAGGSYVNEDYLIDLILQNVKIGFVKNALKIDACNAVEQLEELIKDGVVEMVKDEAFDQIGDMYHINWQLPYEGDGDAPDEDLRNKCLDASETLDRMLRAKEMLTRIKLKEAEA